ncbi:MAG TPA: ribosome silencing factor [Candidatus Paceibacterota bacterium]|nr:ribosome silencing factor [Verrucomicrobiota bacterium]HRY48501.1 ribosome silencing factor [Candidatus Paceibacterota bacterium]HRZ99672.1 ribosome silencing factor [Candidatus Paceibacterota bacterium]
MDSRKLARLCRDLADDKKAENLTILDVRKLTSVTDYFVMATATSEPHLRAIMDEITGRLREEHQLRPRAIDGVMPTQWIVLDYTDVIVHLMRSEIREHYALEDFWGDAPRLRGRRRSAALPGRN